MAAAGHIGSDLADAEEQQFRREMAAIFRAIFLLGHAGLWIISICATRSAHVNCSPLTESLSATRIWAYYVAFNVVPNASTKLPIAVLLCFLRAARFSPQWADPTSPSCVNRSVMASTILCRNAVLIISCPGQSSGAASTRTRCPTLLGKNTSARCSNWHGCMQHSTYLYRALLAS